MKKIAKILLFVMILVFSINSVNALEFPDKLVANNVSMTKTPVSFPTTFHIKKSSDGKYIYCKTFSKKVPTNTSYSKGNVATDPGVNYILSKAVNAKNDNEYFVYQTALWVYMMDKGIMDKSDTITKFKANLSNNSDKYVSAINKLIKEANQSTTSNTCKPSASIDNSNVTFKMDSNGEYYVSSPIKVVSSEVIYYIEFGDSAPEGTKYELSNGSVYVYVPVNNVDTGNVTFTMKVSNDCEYYKSYKYVPDNKAYQVMFVTNKEKLSSSAVSKFSLNVNSIEISKQDAATGKELSGASLVLKDSSGNVVDSWVSTDTVHTIKINPGTYTLEETIAPVGYKLSNESITIEVLDNGSVTKAVMKNEKAIEEKEIEVPNTMSGKNIAISFMGGLILISGAAIITKNLKNKNEE